MEKRHRVTVYLSEEEYELLVERENESGKRKAEIKNSKRELVQRAEYNGC